MGDLVVTRKKGGGAAEEVLRIKDRENVSRVLGPGLEIRHQNDRSEHTVTLKDGEGKVIANLPPGAYVERSGYHIAHRPEGPSIFSRLLGR